MNSKTVFLGGTRMYNSMPTDIQILLKKWIAKNYSFIVGDAPGVDTAFQRFLLEKKVDQVTIFTSAPHLRNNLGSWKSIKIDSGLKTSSHAMHTAKDRYMSQICDLALMIWDELSLGTISNVIDVVTKEKMCFIYKIRSEKIYKIENASILEKFLIDYPIEKLQAEKRLNQFSRRSIRQSKVNRKKLVSLFD